MLPFLLLFFQATASVKAWTQAHEPAILQQFVEFLSIPNVAADKAGLGRTANWIVAQLKQRGVATRLLEEPGVPPVVYGEIMTPGAKQTIVLYAHYDGQPVEPAKWVGGDPFKPRVVDGMIYARSASDDKGAIMAMLAALDAMRAAGAYPKSNLKFFFEGEEEAGSPHVERVLANNKDLLAADLWIFCDGPVHQSGRQLILYGARGVIDFQVTVYGPRRELHSGHYGNWAPNPAMMLAQLLATMKDSDGRVLIPGFYDGVEPLGELEKKAIAAIPNVDGRIRDELALGRTDGHGARLDELLQLPSLNIRGILSGSVGELSRNVIPSEATVSMDIRLVKGLDGQKQVAKVIDYIAKQGYFVTTTAPDEATRRAHERVAYVQVGSGGYNALRTPMDLPICRQLVVALEAARGPVVQQPTSGGSVPMIVFDRVLHKPIVSVPIANYDNNQHSANENIRLQNLWDGIETMAAIFLL
jgi:acetylornithine deacetylase/succinyl-diaminopimelate desuccinylase-like protein